MADPAHGPRPDDEAGDRALLAAFALLLAAALVLHVLWWHGLAVRSPWLAVVLAAAWSAARPASVGRLALLLLAAAVAIVAELPALGSHLLLVLVTAGCVLAHLAAGLVRGGGLPSPGALWRGLAPLLRAQVVVLYVAAALSKLNDVYLDPATSPAGPLSAQVLWFAPTALDGAWHVAPAIWGSLLVELALPVLLVLARTRRAALVLGLTFHAVLALAGTVPFTALMVALYVGFLPAAVPGRIGRDLALRGPLVVAAVLLWLVAAGVADIAPGRTTGETLATATRLLSAGGALLAAGLLVRGIGWSGPGRPARRAPGGVFAVGVAVLVIVAAGPYLGHRAGDAFTMYSGLQTGTSTWNHRLLPADVRVLGD